MVRAILAFQGGEEREANFRLLYLRFFSPVEGFFLRKGFSSQDSLDLTQETFLEIYRSLDAFRGEARFETWLFRIATSTYLKKLRSAATAKRAGHEISTERASPAERALETPPQQLAGVLYDERQRAMRAAVGRLPTQMRRCLTLRLYHELSYREIAVSMKLKIDTVKVHLFRGREKLKEELRDYRLDDLDDRHGD